MPSVSNERQRSRRRRPRTGARARPLYAALDLGTSNCRLLIAHPSGDGFRVVDAFSRIVRLGEGLMQHGRLSEPAMRRAIEALKICARKIDRRKVREIRAVATEACRRADNCEQFVTRVRRETGLDLEIISNSEEALLGLHGCTPLLDPGVPEALIFDIGGGSTEVTWLSVAGTGSEGRRNSMTPELLDCHSIPVGVVTLAEQYGGREISGDTYDAMVDQVAAGLRPFDERHGLAARVAQDEIQMLGTSGTVTTLSGIEKRLPRYDRAQVDGSYLDFETVAGLSRRVATMTYDERVGHPCIGTERADLVVAGCAILEAICETWPVGRLRVADRGLREGILFTLMRDHGRDGDARGNGVPG